MKIEISEKANDDLASIWFFTMNNWSIEQADKYYFLILSVIESISKNFESGKRLRHTDYMFIKVKSHIIFYKKTEGNFVLVSRILHQNMDIQKKLNS